MGRAITARADDLADIISRSTGKTRMDALSTEVLPGSIMASYYARIARRMLVPRTLERSSVLFFSKVSRLTRVPFGVVGIVSPWNYPFGIPLHEVFPALLSGNAVILKVATQVQPVGDAMDRLIRDTGFPPGIFHLVHLPGAEGVDAMLDAGVDKLFFTGSTAAGREVMAKAAARPTPVVLELGGNDPMIILDDANVDRAVAGCLWAGLSNTGQSCAAAERIYVEAGVYAEVRDRLAERIRSLRVGVDTDYAVDVGSLNSAEQKRKVERIVADAVHKGARVVARSGPSTGLFHPIVLLENADDTMSAMREEVFGPIVALQKVRDEREAIERANTSRYGLSASVWSASRRRARRVAEQLRVGSVTINDHLMSHGMPETPWGGFGESGIGRSHGELGFHEMTEPRVIVDEMMHRAPRNMWWYPHDRSVYEGLRGALTLLYGRGVFRRLAGLGPMVRTYLRSFRRW
jgi:succinate-semialdehyde dehydrogenase/glutarate-semialdehyde dehydrogenase